MSGIISLVILIALFYYAPILAITGLALGFMLAPVVILLYVAYRLVAPRLERKLEERSRRREMRKRIRAMLKRNLRYLP